MTRNPESLFYKGFRDFLFSNRTNIVLKFNLLSNLTMFQPLHRVYWGIGESMY